MYTHAGVGREFSGASVRVSVCLSFVHNGRPYRIDNKKLSYRRGTARCVVSVEICQLPRNSAEITCTTSPEQIEVMKLKRYSKAM